MLKCNRNFELNGEPFYIYSGEMHYFRIEPDKLKLHIARAKEAGLNTISTYIPWSWHEYEEGKFDFSGNTHANRDLVKFLDEVKNSGLYLSIRIGPFSNAELMGEGIPKWLTDNYPEVYTTGEGIENLPHEMLISYINPVYRKFIKKWYEQVINIINPYQIQNGGNIIITQLCNEIGMIQWVNCTGDYSAEATSMYQDYLKTQYSSIKKLKNTYKDSSIKDFKDIKQPVFREINNWQDIWDWSDFYKNYYADYYSFLYKTATEFGINTPFIANIPQFMDYDVRGRGLASPMTTSFYRYIPEKINNVVFGGAYQMRRMDYENFHDVMITTQVVKTLTGYSNPVICAELQTGILKDKPRLYASDVTLNLKTTMASGSDGVNCYMLSGGRNQKNMGIFGEYHEWQAPVNSHGETDDKFDAIRMHGEFIKVFGKILAGTEPIFQTTVGWYPHYYCTEFLNTAETDKIVNKRNRYFFDGMCRLLNLNSINFNMIDISCELPDIKKMESLFVFSLSFMEKTVQKKLVKYIQDGGTLILFPELPQKDLAGNSCTYFCDEMGIDKKESFSSLVQFGDNECYVDKPVTILNNTENTDIIAETEEGACCISKKVQKGRLIFLGTPITHFYDYHIDIINKIATGNADVFRNVIINPKDIIGFVRGSNRGSFLFIMNYHQKDYSADINIEIPEYNIDIKKEKIYINARDAKILPINVQINERIKILFSSCEIFSFEDNGKEIKLKFKGNINEKINFQLDISGKVLEKTFILDNKVNEYIIRTY